MAVIQVCGIGMHFGLFLLEFGILRTNFCLVVGAFLRILQDSHSSLLVTRNTQNLGPEPLAFGAKRPGYPAFFATLTIAGRSNLPLMR